MRRVKLAYLVSHPIQYQAPLLRRIAAEPDIDLTVFFGSDFSIRHYMDEGFGVGIKWDVPLVEGYRYEFLPVLRDSSRVTLATPLSRGIFRRLRDGAFDVLWVHGYANVNAIHGMLAAKALGIPVLLRADSSLTDRPRSRTKLLVKEVFFRVLERLVSGVLTAGTLNEAYWRHYFGDRIPTFRMPYAVDNAYFERHSLGARQSRSALQAELQLDPGRPVILFASKLQDRKQCIDLVEAYITLTAGDEQASKPYLVIVGDGEERGALETRVAQSGSDGVRFCGFRNQSELPRFFDLATVFVLPSRHEPWGLIVNEVMNAARPVILSSDVGCHPDLVSDGVEGFVYPVGDVAALVAALRKVLATPDMAEQMGQLALKRIKQWDFEADIRGLRRALASLTHKRFAPAGGSLQPMRILYIIGSLNPESGGPASTVATLVKYSPPDCASEVVTLDDPASPFLVTLNFPVHALGPTRNNFGYTPRLMPWLIANRERFDGVVVHGLWQYNGFAAWRAFKGRTPYVVFAHGMLDPYFKHAFPMKHLKKWAYWLAAQYWILRGAYRVLFTTNAEAELAKQSFFLHRWESHVVRYGASFTDGDEADRRRIFLERFPELNGLRFLLFLGRIDRKKGCDLLIEAFIKLSLLDPELHLVMAGPDERNWRIELGEGISNAGLSKRVHWTGMLKGDEKWGAYLASEAFILPSHQENFGIAVAEAMACRRPVLLSDKVNIAPEIVDAGAGFMEADTASGIERLLTTWISTSAENRRLIGLAGRRLFEQNYDMRQNARCLTDLFRDADPRPVAVSVSSSAVTG